MNIIYKCLICRKEVTPLNNSFRPFCSDRCKTADLSAWASDEYAIKSHGEEINDADDRPDQSANHIFH